MKTHREMYPAQYTHPLVGKRVLVNNSAIQGVVERVVDTRFGLLAHLEGQPATTAWSISNLTVCTTRPSTTQGE